MNEKVFRVLIAQLEEAAVYNFVHKNEVWSKQLEKIKESLLKAFRERQNEIEEWKQDSKMYQEYLDREKDISWLLKERTKRYEATLQKIIDMESPFYFRETSLETPYNYARVALERK